MTPGHVPASFATTHCDRSLRKRPVSGISTRCRGRPRREIEGLILGTRLRRMNRGSVISNARSRQAASDHRRRDPRLRAQRLLQLARLGHRARGGHREWHDLPLLQDQGRHPRPALPREDGRVGGPRAEGGRRRARPPCEDPQDRRPPLPGPPGSGGDRKSTRLNSSHGYISYAVFCLKKKKKKQKECVTEYESAELSTE